MIKSATSPHGTALAWRAAGDAAVAGAAIPDTAAPSSAASPLGTQ
ncbi:hypothetical protein [Streptomyces sp. DSM 40750]|nr:hypothetical protein [Streptomyces sp. DSM 40750]UUU24943.1 hypothetical protein JIX55_34445 [Streptomyces sp. DSM 40750]